MMRDSLAGARFVNVRARLFNRPLLVEPGRGRLVVDSIVAAVGDRIGVDQLAWSDLEGHAGGALAAARLDDTGDRLRQPYDVFEGVAVIPIEGTLVHKLGTMRPFCGMTGYDGIEACFFQAAADPQVRRIVLHINSPGGEVDGCFDLVDAIHAYRTEETAKPVIAILDEMAYSAAYAIASAAEVITVPRTGGVGSVGVVAMHVDMSRRLDAEGITVTLVHAGAHKVDGRPEMPLSDDARARLQAEVDATAGLFHRTVARNRGHAVSGITADAVKALEARSFMGLTGEAVSSGLADLILSPADAMARVIEDAAARPV
jgi:ClpP class serine protease